MESNVSLQSYLANAKSILSRFESTLGWKAPVIGDKPEVANCPLNEGHSVPKDRLESHLQSCKWRKHGYTREEIQGIFDEEKRTRARNDPVLIETDPIISEIAPSAGLIRTDERLKVMLSTEQRLSVYDAEVALCYSSGKSLPDKALYTDLEAKAAEKLYQKENPENLSQLELLQRMRDMKRRRQSYRAKNVHITKRSQTEIIRGVLEVHMEELSKIWNQEQQQPIHSARKEVIQNNHRHSVEKDKSLDQGHYCIQSSHRQGESWKERDGRYSRDLLTDKNHPKDFVRDKKYPRDYPKHDRENSEKSKATKNDSTPRIGCFQTNKVTTNDPSVAGQSSTCALLKHPSQGKGSSKPRQVGAAVAPHRSKRAVPCDSDDERKRHKTKKKKHKKHKSNY